MSAPQIPNLLSLRGKGGTRSRGAGRLRGGFSSPGASHDATIQGTDTDASVSRLSAVELGYMEDPYAQFFVQQAGPPVRRLPIINRGTYTRTAALDRLVSAFLDGDEEAAGRGKRQIISLGAGTDTRPFRLFSHPRTRGLTYHEIDFPAIAAKKRTTVQAAPVLRNIIPTSRNSETSWHNQELPNDCAYFCHGLDLRDLARGSSATPGPVPTLEGIQPDVPTLLISECCLCYLESTQAKAVISHFTSLIPNISVLIYEPIRPSDPFGQQMISNLAARRIRMPTLEVYQEIKDQKTRLKEAGFSSGVEALTMQDIWRKWISTENKEAVDNLEGLDEVEEWDLLASHYAVAWGWRGRGFDGWKRV
ncbi:putative S-adenosyl-L-methionine-dependent methyltransferase [Seiridium cardinale]|uniref:Leucine carboxyl methyltransferase 1 n=1 Tax=Seiridium cardinale TaxID=138064 RepID=A0ABR2XIR8_9PEZI